MITKSKKEKIFILHKFEKEVQIHSFLADLLPRMGFKDVIITHEQGNYPENGKDLVCSFRDIIEDKKEWYAFVVKKGTIGGTSTQINEIESQIKDCFKYEYKSLKTTSERVRISKVKVVTNGHFSSGAKNKILSNDEINNANVDFWDEERLIEIIDKYYPDYWQPERYLLNKLRHEIPSYTETIKFSIQHIRECLEEPDINRNYIQALLNNINLHNSRIYILAAFFTTVGFNLKEFAESRDQVSLLDFLDAYIDIFRTEGALKNVGVYFEMKDGNTTLYVSNYYLFAIVNVITNAIRYAAEGTLVYIEVHDDRLTVTDLGIPIKEDDMEYIFKEGFRSDEARAKCEKGIGYGLYLAKMIFEAHHSKIEPECVYLFKENYYLQKAIYEYLSRIPDDKRNLFIYNGLDRSYYHDADELYKHIRESSDNVDLDMRFYNPQKEMMQKWLDYLNECNLIFLDMEDEYFNKEVYKVTFTIYFKN